MAVYSINSANDLNHLDHFLSTPECAWVWKTNEASQDPYKSRPIVLVLCSETHTMIIDLLRVDCKPFFETFFQGSQSLAIFYQAKPVVKQLLHHYKVRPRKLFCTYLSAKLLSMGNRAFGRETQALVREHLGDFLSNEGMKLKTQSRLGEDETLALAEEAKGLWSLYQAMQASLAEKGLRRVAQLESRTVIPTAEMELCGIGINKTGLEQLAQNLHADIGVLEAEVSTNLPGEDSLFDAYSVNLHSPDQVLKALQRLGLDLKDTGEASIKKYIPQYPFLSKLLEFRHVDRLRTTVERQLLGHIHPITGRIHATYYQIASSSGRYACADPNMQNIPRESFIREHVVPAPGYHFIIADYSQVELRVAAGLSRDPIMCKAYAEGKDLHRLTAALTAEKYVENVTPEERQAAKAINFGLIYAMGARGLQQSAASSYGVKMTLEQAETFRKRFFENYHGLASWQSNMAAEGKRVGYVRTAAGRIRSYRGEDILVTELLNTPVQGTAAEGLKSAMCIFSDQVYDRGLDAHIVAIIHDEIIVEVKTEQAEAVKALLEDAMVKGISWLVPDVTFVADATIASSWADK